MDTSNARELDSAAQAASAPGDQAAPLLVEEHGDDGQLRLRCWMQAGALHGPLEQFGDNGRTLMKTTFEAGKMHGQMAVYTEEGLLIQQSEYQHGIAHGTMKTYVNGRCVSVQQMVDGEPAGPSLSYDEAGMLTARLNLFRGDIQGPAEFFHEGTLVRKSNYKAGLLDGESVDFDQQGSIVQICNYRANLLHGPVRRFWPNGEMMEEVVYREGIPDGPPLRYNPKGERTDNAKATPDILERLQKLVRGS